MPLTDLHNHLQKAVTTLDGIAVKLLSPEAIRLPARSREIFEQAVARKDYLSDAVQLLEVRRTARTLLDELRREMSQPTPVFRLHNVDVRFPIARLMLFQNVVCSNWALYDTIAGACGLMCMTDTMVNNLRRAPNLLDYGQHVNIGARTHEHLKVGYGWNLSICYEIRNWVVHAGENDSSLKLFEFQTPSSAGFKIHDAAWDILVNGAKARLTAVLPAAPVLTILKADAGKTFLDACDEVDKLCSFLLAWSTGSLDLQLQLLCS